eukprot:1167975-Pyramimonas_sp.AAC.1
MEQDLKEFYSGNLIKDLHRRYVDEGGDKDTKDPNIPESLWNEKSFWESIRKDDYKFKTEQVAGNPIASRWKRALDASRQLRADYAATKGYLNKEKFRADWAKRTADEWMQDNGFKETEEKINTEAMRGRYYSLAKIAVEEGGGPQGWRAAMKYA